MELQTSGIELDDKKLEWLRNTIGISTISISLSSIWNSEQNAEYNQTPEQCIVNIDSLCKKIHTYDFNLRLSLNMTDYYNDCDIDTLFNRCKELLANQVTFRVLYNADLTLGNEASEINTWIKKHKCSDDIIQKIETYIKLNGIELETLPFGSTRYSIYGISTVLDDDCMSKSIKQTIRYVILRPNCKLYTKWDDIGSLLF